MLILSEARFWLFLGATGGGFDFSPSSLLRGAIVCTPGGIFNLNVLLDLKEDVSYLGDFMLHQVLVERVTCSLLINVAATMSSLQL